VQKSSARVLQVQAEPPGAAPAARPPGTATAPRPELYCPPPVRDEPALARAVNDRLIEWIGQVGIYPGRLSELREADFGRLVMPTYPDTDEPDRLLAAAKIAMAGWAADDHYCDNPALGAAPAMTGARRARRGQQHRPRGCGAGLGGGCPTAFPTPTDTYLLEDVWAAPYPRRP
jgi:2-methylisoborneol synthase